MFSQIVITFNSESIDGDVIGFKSRRYFDGVDSGLFQDQYETFQTGPRVSNGEIQVVGVAGVPLGTASATRFADYWSLDYELRGYYSVARTDNVVTITYLVDETILFSDFSGGSSATAVINNVVYTDFTLVEQILSQGCPSHCDFFRISIETSSLADQYSINGNPPIANTENPIVLDLPRNASFEFSLQNTSGTYVASIFIPVIYVPKVQPSLFSINVVNGTGGATVTVNTNFPFTPSPTPVYQYSLDGWTWYNSNIFTGQAIGSYTMFIRDTLPTVTCPILTTVFGDEFNESFN